MFAFHWANFISSSIRWIFFHNLTNLGGWCGCLQIFLWRRLHRWWPCHVHIYFNDHVSSMDVTKERVASWHCHWRNVNKHFQNQLVKPPLCCIFKEDIFVWNENHRFSVWWRHIYAGDLQWDYSVFCIVLDSKGQISSLLNCIHDVN